MWELKHVVTKPLITVNPFKIDFQFNKSTLLVAAVSSSADPAWHRAGYLYPIFFVPEVGYVKGLEKHVKLYIQRLTFENIKPTYHFEFYAHDWIASITLKFWESDDPEQLLPSNQIYDGGTF